MRLTQPNWSVSLIAHTQKWFESTDNDWVTPNIHHQRCLDLTLDFAYAYRAKWGNS